MTDLLNSIAPDFSLKDQEGKRHTLSGYRGIYVLLYFYPKDMTTGCTIEAQCFRDRFNDLKALGVQVLGVSVDDKKSHAKFAKKENLNFPILSDTKKKIVKEYGVWNKIFTKRESFLINKRGVIIKHYEKVSPSEHAQEVITDIKELQKALV
jgi:peroxiredoxin Q/BCP